MNRQLSSVPLVLSLLLVTEPTHAAKLTLVAGGQEAKEPVLATEAKLIGPFGVDFMPDGKMFIVEMTGQCVRAVDPSGMLTTIAGSGVKGAAGDGGAARLAHFNGPHSLAVGPSGDLYIADTWNNRVRKIDSRTGVISTIAGTGNKGFSGDGGPAAKADFGGIYCIAFNPKGDRMVLTDLDNRRIRVVNMTDGTVDTVAGNGLRGVPKEGAEAKSSPLVDPRAAAADDQGNIYILERNGDALRVVDPQGKIRTVVGKGATECRDEKGAVPKPLKGPKHLCVDLVGNVYIADTENHVILKYIPADKKLIRIAGTGKKGSAGLNGPPLDAQLAQPHGVHLHPSGVLYISDSSNHRIVKIEP